MSKVKCGLIQMALKGDGNMEPEEIRDRMIEAHIPYIEDAGKQGVQVLCFQEVFTQPYFCPSQDRKWYAAAEKIPDGQTTQLMQEYAKKYNMVIVVPIYEEHMTGVYYNTAAVIDADGKYLGKYRKTHIPQVDPGFYEKFFFKPGDLGYPVFETAYLKLGVYICYDRHFPEGWRALALNGAEYIVNPSATVAGCQQVPLGTRTTGIGCGQRRVHRRHQPHRHRGALGLNAQHGRVLRLELYREPARRDRGAGQLRRRRAARPRDRSRHGARGSRYVAVLPRPSSGDLRSANRWLSLETVSTLRTVGEHIELDLGTDLLESPRYNDDIAPTRASQRTWSRWNVASLWVGMAICVPTYTLGGVLTAYFGLSVAEALWTILIANIIVLIPLTLNAFPGTRYGIPCPVVLRASFGIIGSNVPSLIRALVACGWFGVQTLFGGIAIHLMLSAMFPAWEALGGTGEVLGFFIFWVANLTVVIRGSESIKLLEALAAPLLLIVASACSSGPCRKFRWARCSRRPRRGPKASPSRSISCPA